MKTLHVLNTTVDYFGGPATFAALLIAYALPALVAIFRGHRNALAIAALNVMLGWTALGWIASFVWAWTYVEPKV